MRAEVMRGVPDRSPKVSLSVTICRRLTVIRARVGADAVHDDGERVPEDPCGFADRLQVRSPVGITRMPDWRQGREEPRVPYQRIRHLQEPRPQRRDHLDRRLVHTEARQSMPQDADLANSRS